MALNNLSYESIKMSMEERSIFQLNQAGWSFDEIIALMEFIKDKKIQSTVDENIKLVNKIRNEVEKKTNSNIC